jgi:hypothetical protein
MKALTAFGLFVVLTTTIITLSGFARPLKVTDPTALAKANRLAVGHDCLRQVWPNFDAVCLRNAESGTVMRAVRVVTSQRS